MHKFYIYINDIQIILLKLTPKRYSWDCRIAKENITIKKNNKLSLDFLSFNPYILWKFNFTLLYRYQLWFSSHFIIDDLRDSNLRYFSDMYKENLQVKVYKKLSNVRWFTLIKLKMSILRNSYWNRFYLNWYRQSTILFRFLIMNWLT